MNKEQLVSYILRLEKMRPEANRLGLEIDDDLQSVIGRLVEADYPMIFDEEFPKERFHEKN